MSVFKRWMAVLMACCLLPCLPALAQVNETWVTRAVELISYFESRGDYGCAANDTNGLPSIGFIQWNGNECMELLNKIIAEDKVQALELLGDSLFDKVYGATKWTGRMTSNELSAVSKLLKTGPGIRVQQALAKQYVAGYIEKGMALGIVDATALVYYADIRHQVGSGAIVKYQTLAAQNAGGYGKVTLKHLYDAALKYATHTAARRKKAYEMLRDDPVGSAPPVSPASPTPGPGQTVQPTRVRLSDGRVMTLRMNETLTLTPVLAPANAVSTFTWAVSNGKLAKVVGGVVTPLKPGKLTVRVRTANGLTARVKVRIQPVKVESVTLSGEASMQVGQTQQLTVDVAPEGATNKAVRFRSGNRKVATVSTRGVVKALRRGTVTIYCQARDGSKKVGRIKITVK